MIYLNCNLLNGQEIDRMVLADSNLSPQARWFYALVSSFREGENDIPDGEMAEFVGLSTRSLAALRTELVNAGWMVRHRVGQQIYATVGNTETPAEDLWWENAHKFG